MAPLPPAPRLLTLPLLLFIGGCAVPGPKVDPAYLANIVTGPEETRTSVDADWDDLNAALAVGLGKLNLAVVDSVAEPDGSIRVELVDVLDRPARLRVAPRPGGAAIAAAFTRQRDPEREKLLVGAIAQRLGELHGVDVAPAR